MDKAVNVAKNHEEADEHDRYQNQSKSTAERIADYIELRKRIYGTDLIDVREYERSHRDC